MRSLPLLVSVLLPTLLAISSCASPTGDERLARQAALGATIEHQALRFADQLLYDAIDCAGTPDDNAAAMGQDVVFLALHPPAIADALAKLRGSMRPTATLVSLASFVSAEAVFSAAFAAVALAVAVAASAARSGTRK